MSPVSTKPYLLRAIFEWCLDQGYTPYINVAVDETTRVPREHVKSGQIVLNLSPDATHQLAMGNELITFSARFNGIAQALSVPVTRVAAIYARENGQGMAFEVSAGTSAAEKTPADTGEPAKEAKPADAKSADVGSADDKPDQPTPPGRSHLTRIK